MTIARSITSLFLGALFGIGLTLSGMLNPQKIQDFLDVAGRWDASLLFVMDGALLVTFTTFPIILRRRNPVLGETFQRLDKNDLSAPLVIGAALFGIGWGLGGFCPGPAIASIATGSHTAMLFVFAMMMGMVVHRGYAALFTRPENGGDTTTPSYPQVPPVASSSVASANESARR